MTWHDITLKKFYKIQEFISEPDEYTVVNLLNLIYDMDVEVIPIYKLKEFSIDFLQQPIPTTEIKKVYEINGRKYKSNCDITKVSTAQFIDYQNYIKENPVRLEKILSVFFMPKDAVQYNTGYDIIKLQEDLLDLPIDDVQTISFFFTKQLHLFMRLFLFSLKEQIAKMKIPKKRKKELLEQLDNTHLLTSELYLMSSNIAK